MAATKANNNKDTYLATAYTLILLGLLYLIDKLVHFAQVGLPWVMAKDNMILYAAIIFLLFKRDKSVGCVLAGLWLVLNLSLVMSLFSTFSGYWLPIVLLVAGIILYFMSRR